MDGLEFISKALLLTCNDYNNRVVRLATEPEYTLDEFYCVWMSKTLQNAKGLFASSRSDGLYCEVTYNGDKDEFYVDIYRKLSNTATSGQMISTKLEAAKEKEGI